MSAKVFSTIYNGVCVVAAIATAMPPTVIDVVPAKYKPIVVGAIGAVMWLRSHWNLFVNPDGTPAEVPYQKP